LAKFSSLSLNLTGLVSSDSKGLGGLERFWEGFFSSSLQFS